MASTEGDPVRQHADTDAPSEVMSLLGGEGARPLARIPNTLEAQRTYATDAGGEIAALRQLLDRVELKGLLVQADDMTPQKLLAFCTAVLNHSPNWSEA